jgi:hypothetical protein
MLQFMLSMLLQELWNDDAVQEVTGSLGVVHQFVDMPAQQTEFLDPVSITSRSVSIKVFQTHNVTSFAMKRKYEMPVNMYV